MEHSNGKICQLVQAVERLLQRHAVQSAFHLLARERKQRQGLLEEVCVKAERSLAVLAEPTKVQIKWQHGQLPSAHLAGSV
nr:hypothetical protein [Pseudomonas sp. A-B-19]